ncbi:MULTISPECIES: sugar porter family MFS transporter [Methanobacterium]|uniref:Sugar porter family MFS transporter n=1 Tax=Methanobacterium veterum TaxID=408577 RepID=A0A9E5A412_9EURY|nr:MULTISPECIES: sugar porter family MFS transporter [Methanobacterium]MCZ3366429.1 sugar porter family MFS transporter [Methanobacterium veterum]MCZ3371937.1 sugar porter family MFS transporter [Methanobacterium veterum]
MVKEKNIQFVIIAAVITAIGGMLFGYDTGVISGAILFIRDAFSLSSTAQEIVVSSVLIGAVIGASISGFLADKYGRRIMVIVAATIFGIGAIFTALTPEVYALIAGRIVVGIAIGIASFIAPLYIAEVAPVSIRGALVSLNQLAITVGIVISYLVDFAFAPSGGWRWMLGLAVVPSIILGIGMYLMPPSPRWLYSKGRIDKARSVLERIRMTKNVSEEMKEIRASLVCEQECKWSEILDPVVRPALIIGIGLAAFQQLTGINTVIYYAPTILEFAGFQSAAVSILATAGIGMINVIMTIVAISLIDRVGRRPLLLIGLIGMVISLAILGIAFVLPGLSTSLGLLAVISLMLYVGSFAIGLGPVFWLMISEIYPLRIRGRAMSTATIVNWGTNLVVAITFLSLIQLIGTPGTFWLYSTIGIIAWVFVYFLVPETKGKSLEEIEMELRAGKHIQEMKNAK